MKALFGAVWSRFIGIDTRLKNSAVATIFLSIVTGLLISVPGYLKDDPKPVQAGNITRELYATKLVEQGCHFDRFIALEKKTLVAIQPMMVSATPENFVAGLQQYVDFARSVRPVVGEMQRNMQGVVPPAEFAEDHARLQSSLQVLQKIVDDLDKSLPVGLHRPANELLADPQVIEKTLMATRVITGAATALGDVTYSDNFNRLMTCPDLGASATFAR